MVDALRRTAPVTLAAILAVSSTAAPARAEPPDPDPWLGPDKAIYFGVAAAITGGGYGVCSLVADDMLSRSIVGVGFGVGAISFRGLIDLADHGDSSPKELFWGYAGLAVGLGISISIDLVVRAGQPAKTP